MRIRTVLAALLPSLVLASSLTLPALAQYTAAPATSTGAAAVGTSQQIRIDNRGQVTLDGLKVTALNAPNITATATWGSTVFTWNITTTDSTKFVRRYSGSSSFSELTVGDYIGAKGSLDTSASQPTVNATWVKDWSIQTKNATFHGTVSNMFLNPLMSFILNTGRGNVTVRANSSTEVRRGSTKINFGDLVNDETVTATGLYNNLSSTLQASKILAQQPERRTYKGALKSIAGTTAPTSLILTVGTTDYTVNLSSSTTVTNKLFAIANLTSFVAGNQLSVVGTPQANSSTTIDATMVRNLSL